MVIESRNQIKCPELIEKLGEKLKKDIYIINKKKLSKSDFPREEVFKESSDFNLKHNTLKSRVLQILKQDKYARKDDFYLCLKIWILSNHIKLIVPLEDFGKIYKPESISRCRRELISESKTNKDLKWLLNDEETLNNRNELSELNRGYYQDKNNSEMAKVIK